MRRYGSRVSTGNLDVSFKQLESATRPTYGFFRCQQDQSRRGILPKYEGETLLNFAVYRYQSNDTWPKVSGDVLRSPLIDTLPQSRWFTEAKMHGSTTPAS